MANVTTTSVDTDFGPFFNSPTTPYFDFTLLFEDTILSLLPSALLLLVAPVRVWQLWNASQKVAVTQLRNIKTGLLLLYSLLQTVNLVLWILETHIGSRASIAAASMSFAVALALCSLSYLEHTRSVRPSPIINFYLLLTVFMDATKVRTLWLRGGSVTLAGVESSMLAVKLFVLFVEAHEKRGFLLLPYSDYSPEMTSGIYSRSLFWWLNPMFLLGYKSIIREIDLFPTDHDLSSETLSKTFERRWANRNSPASRYELHLTVARCLLRPFAAGAIPRVFQSFFRYMQPLLIRRVTTFITERDSPQIRSIGWALVAASGLVYFGTAVSAAKYNHQAFRLTTMVRGALVTAVFTKTMDLSVASLDENAAVTLMSTDVQRACDAIPRLHELWAAPIDIAIAIWLLHGEIGWAVTGPLVATILSIAATFAVSARSGLAQKSWVASIQTRIDVTAKAIQSMKGVKMLGLTTLLHDMIQRLRENEIARSLQTRRLFVCSIIVGNSTDLFAPGIAFTIFVIIATYNGQTLNVSSAYTALSLISLLANPIGVLAFTVPQFMSAVGCFDRIQEYLLSASRKDHRLFVSGVQSTTTHKPRFDTTTLPVNDVELQNLQPQHMSLPATKEPAIRVVDLTLKWTESGEPVINDVSFELFPGVTMLIGPVGSGKSSLIKGLLGEIPSSKGYIYTDALQIAFVGQNPWIQHGSLRESIIGTLPFDPKLYARVVDACALDRDFSNMPQGDHSQVGAAGAGLSGGQKLRVALARAVYSRNHIMILDDVFSGLDAGSEDRIFSRLLGKNGLLRETGTTVLLATHAVHRLSYADQILVLSPHGAIVERGVFRDLLNAHGYVSSLAARHTTESNERQGEAMETAKDLALTTNAQVNAASDLSRAVGDWSIYKYYFASWGYRRTFLLQLGMMTWVFFLTFPDLWIKFWTSAVAAHGNSVNKLYLSVYLTLLLTAWFLLSATSYLMMASMIPISARTLHSRLLSTVRRAPLSFFTSTDIGQVVNRFSQDMSVIDFELPMALFEFLAGLTIGSAQAILICLSTAYFAALMPAVAGLLYLIQKFYLRTSRQIRLMDLEAKAPLYSHFIESVAGLTTIRAFGWVTNFEQRNLDLLDRSQRPFYLLFCIQRWLNLVLDLVVMGLAVLLMVLIVTLRTKLDAGLVGLAMLSIMNFNLSLTTIVKEWTNLETALGAISRVKSFVQTTDSEHLPQERAIVTEAWPQHGAINFVDVCAAYTPAGDSVLNHINLQVPQGQKLGLVGRSGSGKSSFVATLFHLLEITNGAVLLDGVDLATIPRETVRQRLNVIPQEPLFMTGTVRLNLDPFETATSDNTLISTLSTVGLWNIVSAAGGLDVTLDPENLLSHGQRQLFCLARAIVNKDRSPILVLDEATASVDVQTDETMQRIIRAEFSKCTIIAVAHRLGTIRDFDRIVVLDKGRIVEDGEPEELLRNESGWFRRLWDS